MARRYWVVGGIYTDTSFSTIADGRDATRLGPFDTYDEAKAVWRAKSMEHVDEAHARFSIEREATDEYWVVGGTYTDTNFMTIAGGGRETSHGPYPSRVAARKKWWELSSAAVDDAYTRYRIEQH